MKEYIKKTLKTISFSEKYIQICNDFPCYDLGMTLKKNDVDVLLKSNMIDLAYASKDKTYYKDYIIKDINIRFSFTFKYGFIECFYAIWNLDNSERIVGRFNSIATIIDEDFRNKVKYNFPIATTSNDLAQILKQTNYLHEDFLNQLEINRNQPLRM
jgi:hypothetical protein